MSATLSLWLERAARDPAAGIHFYDRQEKRSFASFADIAAAAARVGTALAAFGVRPGDRVALLYPTCREFLETFFGVLHVGAVPVPLYPPVRLGRLEEYHRRTAAMLLAAEAKLALADTRLRPLLGPTLELAQPREEGRPLECHTLKTLLAPLTGAENTLPAHVGAPDDLGLVQFSSGTTVDPKPVALSQRAIVTQVEALNRFWKPLGTPRPTGFSWLPLYHDMGLVGCVFTTLAWPSELTLMPPELFIARPALWLRGLARTRATISVAPNFAYGLCLEKIRDEEMEGVDLSAWRVALCGAEPVSPAVLRAFLARFARWGLRPEVLTPVYGLSEATLAISFSRLELPFESRVFQRDRLAQGQAVPAEVGTELASLGSPLPGTEMRILSDAGEVLPERKVGRLEVRGPSLMEGYLGRPEATAAVLKEGWLDTGDLGFLDRGELFLTGRAKDIVLLRGRNYAPADLEQALDVLPGVRKGCSVAASHFPEKGDRELLYLFVERAQSTAGRENEDLLAARVREVLLEVQGLLPDHVVVLEPGTLPRTSSGKLRRREALRLYLAGELLPPRKVGMWFLLGAWVRSRLAFRRLRKSANAAGTAAEE